VNATWRVDIINTKVAADRNISAGGMTMRIEMAYDLFVDPSQRAASASSLYGIPYPLTAVHPNAMLAGLTPVNMGAMREPEGAWETTAIPFLLAPGAPQAVFFTHLSSVADIVLPPIPGFAPRWKQQLQFIIPGAFLLSGTPKLLPDFTLTINATGNRDCVVGAWNAWSTCPALPCSAPGLAALGSVPVPTLLQQRSRPVIVYPIGPAPATLQCPPLMQTRPCSSCDPCVGVSCDNGGVCVEGTCRCPDSYSGVDCSLPPPSLSICRSWTDSDWSSCLVAQTSQSGSRFRFVNCTCRRGPVRTDLVFANGSYIHTSVTPSNTPSASSSVGPTVSVSITPTISFSPTATAPSATSTATGSDTPSASVTPTISQTGSVTPTPSETPTPSQTPSGSNTASQTPTGTPTPSNTPSPRSSVTSTPSRTPSQFWFNTTLNMTQNATVPPIPVYAPASCGSIPVPVFQEACRLPTSTVTGLTAGANLTVVRITLPLVELAGVNGSALMNSATVFDAWSGAFVAHLTRALGMVLGQILPVGLGRCGGSNFVPAGQVPGAWARITPSPTPMRQFLSPRTGQLQGSGGAVCVAIEFVEDVSVSPVLASQLLYRLAVILGAGASATQTGGADLRPLQVTGITPGTHLLAPLARLASPAGTGFASYAFLAVADVQSGDPPGLLKQAFLSQLPGIAPGFMPSPVLPPVDAGVAIVRAALYAFVALFVVAAFIVFLFLRYRGFSDRAPRPKRRASGRAIGEPVTPVKIVKIAAESKSGKSGEASPRAFANPLARMMGKGSHGRKLTAHEFAPTMADPSGLYGGPVMVQNPVAAASHTPAPASPSRGGITAAPAPAAPVAAPAPAPATVISIAPAFGSVPRGGSATSSLAPIAEEHALADVETPADEPAVGSLVTPSVFQ